MPDAKKFTLAQVKEHNNEKDLWLIIHDKVYDVTKFLNEHPGGEDVLIQSAGKDATREFDDVGHSDAAMDQLKGFYIGDIVDAEKKSKKNYQNVIMGGSSALAVGLGALAMYLGYKVLKSN